jgi:hypothetical protein
MNLSTSTMNGNTTVSRIVLADAQRSGGQEYAVLFDEAMQISCDYISDIVVERAIGGLDAFCDITRRPAHTQAAGRGDHNG